MKQTSQGVTSERSKRVTHSLTSSHEAHSSKSESLFDLFASFIAPYRDS